MIRFDPYLAPDYNSYPERLIYDVAPYGRFFIYTRSPRTAATDYAIEKVE